MQLISNHRDHHSPEERDYMKLHLRRRWSKKVGYLKKKCLTEKKKINLVKESGLPKRFPNWIVVLVARMLGLHVLHLWSNSITEIVASKALYLHYELLVLSHYSLERYDHIDLHRKQTSFICLCFSVLPFATFAYSDGYYLNRANGYKRILSIDNKWIFTNTLESIDF